MLDNELIILVNSIRKKRKISIDLFISDIVDIKQYRKYLNYESKVPFDTIVKLSDRLDMRFEDLLLSFLREQFKESEQIISILSYISNNCFNEAKELISNIDSSSILQNENRIFFETAKLLVEFNSDNIPLEHFKKGLEKLVSYPKILKKERLSISEVYILGELLDITTDNYHTGVISNKILHSLTEDDYDYQLRCLITTRFIPFLTSNGRFEEAITIAKIGVEKCIGNSATYLLEYLYYALSWCYKKNDMTSEKEDNILKCYSTLTIKNDKNTYEKFNQLFEKNYGENLEILVSKILLSRQGK